MNLPVALIFTALTASLACGNDTYHHPPPAKDGPSPFPSNLFDSIENPRSEDSDPSERDTSQRPSASADDESTAPDRTSVPPGRQPVTWTRCGSGRCATLAVPIDYSEPSRGTLDLRVFVAPAELQAQRQGVLLFNPGGPGVPVVQDADAYHQFLASYFPTFDIVLMDNRGMGESTPVNCVDATFVDEHFGLAGDPWTLTSLDEIGEVWRNFERGCIERMGETTLSSLHSNNVARDMDVVRQVLGEDKLNLWNVSYGTVQASIYAKLFPEHVRSFVLDSPVYFADDTNNVVDVDVLIAAYDTELDRFLAWCGETGPCNLGTTPERASAGYDALRETLREGVAHKGVILTASHLDSAAASTLMYGEWSELARVVRSAVDGNWGPLLEAASGGDDDSDRSYAMFQSNLVVRGLDYRCPSGYSSARALERIDNASVIHPRIADVYSWLFTFCLGWETQPTEVREVTQNIESPPLLILTSAHDPATPLSGANQLLTQLNNDSQLLVIEKEGHGVIGSSPEGTNSGVRFIERGTLEECAGLNCSSFRQARAISPKPRLPRLPHVPVLPVKTRRHQTP
jgi:pimeloyl-ACP methyl ester carboxylesterase